MRRRRMRRRRMRRRRMRRRSTLSKSLLDAPNSSGQGARDTGYLHNFAGERKVLDRVQIST
jgi:hypothetical protein